MIDLQSRRSLPNCTIDYEIAERMYQATKTLLPVDGNPDRAQIIGGYLGWALDEIDRLREAIVEERARCNHPWSFPNRITSSIDDAIIVRVQNEAEDEARKQLISEGKIGGGDHIQSKPVMACDSCGKKISEISGKSLPCGERLIGEVRFDPDEEEHYFWCSECGSGHVNKLTDEQRRAISHAIDQLEIHGGHKAAVVLRAMLEEAIAEEDMALYRGTWGNR